MTGNRIKHWIDDAVAEGLTVMADDRAVIHVLNPVDGTANCSGSIFPRTPIVTVTDTICFSCRELPARARHERLIAEGVLCPDCGHPTERHDFAGSCGVTVTDTKFCSCTRSFL